MSCIVVTSLYLATGVQRLGEGAAAARGREAPGFHGSEIGCSRLPLFLRVLR